MLSIVEFSVFMAFHTAEHCHLMLFPLVNSTHFLTFHTQ